MGMDGNEREMGKWENDVGMEARYLVKKWMYSEGWVSSCGLLCTVNDVIS